MVNMADLLFQIVDECCSNLQRIAGCKPFSVAQQHDNMESVRASAPGAFNNTRSSHGSLNQAHAGSSLLKSVHSNPDFSPSKHSLQNRSYDSFTSVEFKSRFMGEYKNSPQVTHPHFSCFNNFSQLLVVNNFSCIYLTLY